jgi:hypothetical protein
MAAATAIIAGVGVAVSAAGTAMSFGQAAQQQKNIRSAQAKADQAMNAARKKLEVNYYDQLSLPMQEIENQRMASLVQGAQALSPELGRAAAATAGRVQMAQNEAQAGITAAAEKQLFELDKMSAMEDSRLRDINVQLDMGEIAGAQQAAADAQQASANLMDQGFQGIGDIAKSVDKFVPLFPNIGNKTDFKQVQNENLKNMNVMGSGMSSASDAAGTGAKPKTNWSQFPASGDYQYGLFPTFDQILTKQSNWNQYSNPDFKGPYIDFVNFRENNNFDFKNRYK